VLPSCCCLPLLCAAWAQQVLLQVNNFSAINCSNTLWAFASLRHYEPALFDALLSRMDGHLDEVEPQNVANSLYALARVNHPMDAHTGAQLPGMPTKCHNVAPHSIQAGLLWGSAGFSVMRKHSRAAAGL
jgi:hypothetical protein